MYLKYFELKILKEDLKVDIVTAYKELDVDRAAYILHDKDCEPAHYHIVFQSILGVCLDAVVSAFRLPNDHSIVKIKGPWNKIYDYFIHNTPHSKEKYQYDCCDIAIYKKITA